MYPHERSLVKALKNEPFALIGINSDKDRKELQKVVQEEQITWRSFWDGSPGGPIAKAWGIKAWPSIFVLDHKGVIRFKDLRGEPLEEAVRGLLREQQADAGKQPVAKTSIAKTETPKRTERKQPAEGDAEKQAGQKLAFAKSLAEAGKVEKARTRCEEIIKNYPNTQAAKQAKELLEKLPK